MGQKINKEAPTELNNVTFFPFKILFIFYFDLKKSTIKEKIESLAKRTRFTPEEIQSQHQKFLV